MPDAAQMKDRRRTFLLLVLERVGLVDPRPEVGRVSSERDLQRRQELVHAGQQVLRAVGNDAES